ncbi:restriction endonuclease subunit S [Salmonella enterica subsp. enterica serovar Poona]|nr:restriction endonuclease subunit S [Salmonella enterica subsp. enterica serovar Poona]EDP9160982.1 restriction endonuclease subunit S [Salmonella enterica subsp. enterica serovar Poona]
MTSKLSDLCTFADKRVAVADLDLDTYISTENMLPNKEGITCSARLPNVSQTQAYQVGDVLISNIRPYFRKIWFADCDGGCSNDVLVLRAKNNVYPNFLYYLLSDDNFFDYVTATAKGTKMPRGDKGAIMQYEVLDLPLDTQIRIAGTLSALDGRIANNTAINHHLASPRLATDSSPDIRRGNKESRKFAKRLDSCRLHLIRSNIKPVIE